MCEFCSINKEKEYFIYEDKLIKVFFSPNPITKGHVIITPTKHVRRIEDLDETTYLHIFKVVNVMASIIFQLMNDQTAGTNIILNEGDSNDNPYGHLYVNIIPRKKDDGLKINWDPKPAQKEKLKEIADRINNETFYLKYNKEENINNTKISKTDKPKNDNKEENNNKKRRVNYLLKQLDRIP